MTERSYTVKEIDALRQCCENKLSTRHYKGFVVGEHNGVPIDTKPGSILPANTVIVRQWDDSWPARIEAMVQTHMLAGHTAEDLIKSEEE